MGADVPRPVESVGKDNSAGQALDRAFLRGPLGGQSDPARHARRIRLDRHRRLRWAGHRDRGAIGRPPDQVARVDVPQVGKQELARGA